MFQDVDDIPDGEVFEDVLGRALLACRVGLVVIGPRWLDSVDDTGRRRVDIPDDWVRTEVRLLLERAKRVIPVLVGGARMPRADSLPEDIRPLAKRQAREVRDSSWEADVSALINGLDEAFSELHPPQLASRPPAGRGIAWIVGAVILLLSAAAAGFYWSRGGWGQTGAGPEMLRIGDPGPVPSPSPADTVARATALSLPGTRWTRKELFGYRDPSAPNTYKFVVRDGAVLLEPEETAKPGRMLVMQIQGRTITLVDPPVEGEFREYMNELELAIDGSTIDKCQTLRIATRERIGPCSMIFRRSAASTSALASTPVQTIR